MSIQRVLEWFLLALGFLIAAEILAIGTGFVIYIWKLVLGL